MLLVLALLLGLPINLIGGIITTGIGLSVSISSFVNRTTVWWSALSFTIAECAATDTSVYEFSVSLSLHDYMALFYHDIMSHSHIILSGWFHIKNWYCSNSALHLCTM